MHGLTSEALGALLALIRASDPNAPRVGPSWEIFALAGVALLLIVVLRFVLPPADRRPLRGAFVMILAWGLATTFWAIDDVPAGMRDWCRFLSLVFIALVMVRVGWLFVMDWALRRGEVIGLSKIWRDVVKGLMYLVAAIAAARAAGADPRTLAATGGLVTAGLTFSMQQTLSDLVAGVLLQAEAPFKVGDWIAYGDQNINVGRVVEINWRATKLTTMDRIEVTVPNSLLAKTPITNFSEPIPPARRHVHFVTGYDVPPNLVQQLAVDAARGAEGVLEDQPVSCVVQDFNERGVRYWLRYFIDDQAVRDVIDSGVRVRLWYALRRAGVRFAFPRTDLALLGDGAAERAEAEQAEAERRYEAFRHVDFLAPLSEAERRTLARKAGTRVVAPGETVFRAGEQGTELYLVAHGRLAVRSEDGGRVLATLKDNDFFGEMAMLTGERRSATVQAQDDCVLYVIDKAAFEEAIQDHREVLTQVSHIVAERQSQNARRRGADETQEQRTRRQETLLERMRRFFGR